MGINKNLIIQALWGQTKASSSRAFYLSHFSFYFLIKNIKKEKIKEVVNFSPTIINIYYFFSTIFIIAKKSLIV